ncbi:MAG TPA: hypothetical protein VMT37_14850 [Solirubrobacterales bacterium]|nr:hypothetical protein [Solirubrobacterales bacterium]
MALEQARKAAVAVHQALAAAAVPHAIGGSLAAALYFEPRPVADLDVNVFLPGREWRRAVEALLAARPAPTLPVHLFFSHDLLHEAMPAAVHELNVDGTAIPLVAPEHILARKLLLDRPKDREDIERWLTG